MAVITICQMVDSRIVTLDDLVPMVNSLTNLTLTLGTLKISTFKPALLKCTLTAVAY